jgi:hypothetical protein
MRLEEADVARQSWPVTSHRVGMQFNVPARTFPFPDEQLVHEIIYLKLTNTIIS